MSITHRGSSVLLDTAAMPYNGKYHNGPSPTGMSTKPPPPPLSSAQEERASAARKLPAAHGIPPLAGYHKTSFPKDAPRPSKEWMAAFCSEPEGDAATCCLGWWVPCALYGKTHWRLFQLLEQKDPLNSSWKAKKGFNPACCIYALWMSGGRSCECVPTAFERNRIRATYGIDGSCGGDFCCACWCNQCVLMQNDREVRAREGEMRCRTNHRFGADMVRRDRRPRGCAVPMLITLEPAQQSLMLYPEVGTTTEGSSPAGASSPTGSILGMLARSHPAGSLLNGTDFLNKPAQYQASGIIIKPEFVPAAQLGNEMIDLTKYPTDDATATVVGKEERSSPEQDAANISSKNKIRPPPLGNPATKENAEASLSNVADQRRIGSAPSLKSCITLVIGCDDEEMPVGRRNTKSQKMQQMSYIHDFTTSDVDRKVLEYYENEANSEMTKREGPTATEAFYSPPHADLSEQELYSIGAPSNFAPVLENTQVAWAQVADTLSSPSPPSSSASSNNPSSSSSHNSNSAERLPGTSQTESLPTNSPSMTFTKKNPVSSLDVEPINNRETTPNASVCQSGSSRTHTIRNCPNNASKLRTGNEHYLDDCKLFPRDNDFHSEKSLETSQEHISEECSDNVSFLRNKGNCNGSDDTHEVEQKHVAEKASINDNSSRRPSTKPHNIEECDIVQTKAKAPIEHRVDECCSVDGAMEPVNNATRERNSDSLSKVLTKAFKIPDQKDQEANEKARAVIAKTNALREFLARAKAHQISYQEQDDSPPPFPTQSGPGNMTPVPRGLDLHAITKARRVSTKGTVNMPAEQGCVSPQTQSPQGHKGFEQM